MLILRVPKVGKLARLTISPSGFGSASVGALMTVTSSMQSISQHREFASAEEAERAGTAWAEQHNADALVIDGGVN